MFCHWGGRGAWPPWVGRVIVTSGCTGSNRIWRQSHPKNSPQSLHHLIRIQPVLFHGMWNDWLGRRSHKWWGIGMPVAGNPRGWR